MTDHAIKKPILFISHATSDADFANAVKQEIEKVFANGLNVFCTTSPGTIDVGTDWLSEIEQKLGIAQAVIAIITPISIERPWIWFEIGATWAKGRSGECHIYPLCAPEIELANLPSPLDRLQALSMGKATDLKLLFEALIRQFGFGQISSFRASNISKRIPKYKNVKVVEADRIERSFYSGRYSGYSDEELMEVIDTKIFAPDDEKFGKYNTLYRGREELLHNGKLIHFQDIDRSLELPPGTARRLLNLVAERYDLIPVLEKDNVVRYGLTHRRYATPTTIPLDPGSHGERFSRRGPFARNLQAHGKSELQICRGYPAPGEVTLSWPGGSGSSRRRCAARGDLRAGRGASRHQGEEPIAYRMK